MTPTVSVVTVGVAVASRLTGERKLKISDVARETGLHRNTVALLYHETATRVDLPAIDALCRYFGVQVGDLFEYRADAVGNDSSAGPA